MSPRKIFKVVGLGEILWDLFPEGKLLGGAPANFTYHINVLGNQGLTVSSVGSDVLGREILDTMREQGIAIDYIQINRNAATGTVRVTVSASGEPRFSICPVGTAWDHITWTKELAQLAAETDGLCFGSLAQRAPESRATIRRFIRSMANHALRIFDVNLRQSYYSSSILSESLELCSVVKLNNQELPIVLDLLGFKSMDDEEHDCRLLLKAFVLDLVCLTRGAEGSIMLNRKEVAVHPGINVEIKDTVGAGDGFTAVLAHHLLKKSPLNRISEAANRYGAWIAGRAGATPEANSGILKEVV
jgi:fructokinase